MHLEALLELLFFFLGFLVGGRETLGVGQVVDGDGQEDVEQNVVAANEQRDEVEEREDGAQGREATIRPDARVHHFVPVLAGEYLFCCCCCCICICIFRNAFSTVLIDF